MIARTRAAALGFAGGLRTFTPLPALRIRGGEIAQALFVTIQTVEMHVTHAYRKLDITRLPGALGSQ